MKKFCLLLSALVSLVANAQLAPNYHRLQPPPNPPGWCLVSGITLPTNGPAHLLPTPTG